MLNVPGRQTQLCTEQKRLWIWEIVVVRVEGVCLTLEVGGLLVKTGCLSGCMFKLVVLWLKLVVYVDGSMFRV